MDRSERLFGSRETVITAAGPLRLEIDEEGIVRRVERPDDPAPAPALPARLTTLGLVDLQVNGFAGIDFNRPSLDVAGLEHSLRAMLRSGVTRCLPTLVTGGADHLRDCCAALDRAIAASPLAAAMVMGIHLEGPFISALPGYVGCHPPIHARDPDLAMFDGWQRAAGGRIRLVTLAPERPGAIAFIRALRARGVAVAIGHSAAGEAEIAAAIEAGAGFSTHLGNGTAPLLPKSANVILSQLADDRLAASFIADGLHLSPTLLRTYVRAKTPARSFLVSDAVAAAATAEGRYSLGELVVERRQDGSARSPGGALAGSTLTMDRAVSNARAWLGCDWPEALRLGRSRALAQLGIESQPRAGDPAELAAWRGEGAEMRVAAARIGPFIVGDGRA